MVSLGYRHVIRRLLRRYSCIYAVATEVVRAIFKLAKAALDAGDVAKFSEHWSGFVRFIKVHMVRGAEMLSTRSTFASKQSRTRYSSFGRTGHGGYRHVPPAGFRIG